MTTPPTTAPNVIPPLTAEASRVLRHVASGGRVEARRTYPHAHHFTLYRVEVKRDGTAYAPSEISALTVSELLTRGLLLATPLDGQADAIDYAAAPDAAPAVERGTLVPPPDPTQVDLFAEPPAAPATERAA